MFEFIKVFSDTVLDVLILRLSWQSFAIYWGYVSVEVHLPSSGSEYKLLNTFEFINAVSDTVVDMINTAYHDKSFICTGGNSLYNYDN